MTYLEKLAAIQKKNDSWLCIDLDPIPKQLPLAHVSKYDEPVLPFNKEIIKATADLVCAYKLNLGFYLQWGASGMIALERTIAFIPDDIPVIFDCKAGDSGNAQAAWAEGLFDLWRVDALTVNPFAGEEAIRPIIGQRPDKAVYILARTANASAVDFQGSLDDKESISAEIVHKATTWQMQGHLGFAIETTDAHEVQTARKVAPTASFLLSSNDLATAAAYGSDLVAGPLIHDSNIIFSSCGLDFVTAARNAALALRAQIKLAATG